MAPAKVKNALLAIIVVALIVIVILLASGRDNEGPKPEGGSLRPGEIMTGDQVEQNGIPVRKLDPVDRNRILQSYPADSRYRLLAKVTLRTRASHKDWGVEQVMSMNYAAECEILRHIESNDGQRLVETREFSKCRNISIYSELEDIRINAGPAGRVILAALDMLTTSPGVYSSLDGLSAKPVLDLIPGLKDTSSHATKAFAFVDTLQGKKVRITYENGKGVTQIEPIGCTLDEEEQAMVFDTAALSDAYMLPDVDCKVGDSWSVNGADLLPILDPSLRSSVSGQVVVQRTSDQGASDQATAHLRVTQGMISLQSIENASVTVGRWAPRGDLVYSFKEQLVTEGRLSGDISMESRSTDHILFESRIVAQPSYSVVYSCEVLR